MPDSEAGTRFATVRDHDVLTRSGTVIDERGIVSAYAADAFDAGVLRLLRSGQRVRVRYDGERITAITLATFELP